MIKLTVTSGVVVLALVFYMNNDLLLYLLLLDADASFACFPPSYI